MKSILEISPKAETTYTMPDQLYELIAEQLWLRFYKTARQAVAALPADLRAQVVIEPRPRRESVVRGWRANVLMIDDFAFPGDAPLEFKQEYECEFWEEPKPIKPQIDRVPPFFPDQ